MEATKLLEERLKLPLTTLNRLTKDSLVDVRANNRIAKPTVELIGKCASLFVLYVTDAAAAESSSSRKK